jgi:4-carboxymuconolactone decarboxylase
MATRIDLITDPSQLSESGQAEFEAIEQVLGHVSGPFSILLHSPGLAQKVMEAGAHVRLKSTLEKWQRELAILAVAKEKDSDFEWASHVGVAREAGLRDEAIETVRSGGDVRQLKPDERNIISFVRELLRTNHISGELFDELLAAHDERWLVELTGTVGQYQYIAAVLGVFEVRPAPGKEVISG